MYFIVKKFKIDILNMGSTFFFWKSSIDLCVTENVYSERTIAIEARSSWVNRMAVVSYESSILTDC